ncbi:MAG TPA: hypothetical protein PLE26_01665 [Candidatus Paceibacterota bacterium]|nr:hypothetical protein [Candidatus Paceibacterota bacterium]HQB57163.1 hypothetical protein [Candidatus Paceibacterota bacterium]
MAGFIKDYFNNLSRSDEKTKHRSALTISIVTSVIILSILFVIFKDFLFFKNQPAENVREAQIVASAENKIASPLTSFTNFFKETNKQFSNLKSVFGGLAESLNGVEKNSVSTTSSESNMLLEANISE